MRLLAGLLAAAALLLSGCGGASTAQDAGGAGPADATPLAFTGQTVAGDAFDGASLAGKPVVFWFWAPWCPTCKAQVEVMDELSATYGEQVTFVGVGGLDTSPAIADFAGKVSPAVTELTDEQGAVWRHFGVTAQSTYVIVESDGTRSESGSLSDDELTDLVAKLAST